MKNTTLRFTHSSFSVQTAKKIGIRDKISTVREQTYEVQVDDVREFEKIADKIELATKERPVWSAFYDNAERHLEARTAS